MFTYTYVYMYIYIYIYIYIFLRKELKSIYIERLSEGPRGLTNLKLGITDVFSA
jgi:hypothetical protein